MSHIIKTGDRYHTYSKFKAFLDRHSPPIIWADTEDGHLVVKAFLRGFSFIWHTEDSGEKTTFHADFGSTSDEID